MGISLQTIIGVIVSVGLFLAAYRKTLGARKERIRAANTELEKTLLKRIVLESYMPAVDEVGRIIEAKARDYAVKTKDLLSESQMLNTLFTRIVESDLINPEQRNDILGRIFPVLQELEHRPVEEYRISELPSDRRRLFMKTIVPLFLGIIASIIGVIVAKFPNLSSLLQLPEKSTLTVFIASLSIIVGIYIFYRFREVQEQVGSEDELRSTIKFEQDVEHVLKRIGANFTVAGRDSGADFIAEISGKKFLIEIKTWSHRPPISLIRNVVNKLRHSVDVYGADRAILITKGPLDIPRSIPEDAKVSVMTIREFRNYLMHKIA